MAPAAGEPEHPKLVSIARDVHRAGRRIDELDGLVRRLGVDLSALNHHLASASPGPGAGQESGVWAWLLAEGYEQAEADLADLIGWLDRVYLVYPGVNLPTCWLWHPTVVEELWWLRNAHAEAYHPVIGSWVRAGDWHDRLRPNVVDRIRKAVVACEVSEHRYGARQSHAAPRAPLASAVQVIAEWVAAGRPGSAPEPTAAHLEESQAVHEELLRRTRR